MRYYDDEKLNISEEIKAQFAHDNFSFEVKEFIGARMSRDGTITAAGGWKGFTAADNSWEDLVTLQEDVPVLVANYSRRHLYCHNILGLCKTLSTKSACAVINLRNCAGFIFAYAKNTIFFCLLNYLSESVELHQDGIVR